MKYYCLITEAIDYFLLLVEPRDTQNRRISGKNIGHKLIRNKQLWAFTSTQETKNLVYERLSDGV
jgi:hypothetical protein